MISAVLDASAVLVLVRDDSDDDKVAAYAGRVAMSAVNLQELAKEPLVSGLELAVVSELLGELRLDVCPHESDAAYAAAAPHERTRQHGRGFGDRSCLAMTLALGVPALTADRERKKVRVKDIKVELVR